MRLQSSLTLMATLLLAGRPQTPGIERVAWLAGCWEARSPGRTVEEQWMVPRAHSMVSMGRTVRGDSLLESEQVILREQGGKLAYEAHPARQAATVFLAVRLTDSSVVFENLQHDFPQRVGYQRRGADSLLAWIEGSAGGRNRRIEFPYGRVRCPGAP